MHPTLLQSLSWRRRWLGSQPSHYTILQRMDGISYVSLLRIRAPVGMKQLRKEWDWAAYAGQDRPTQI